MAHPGKSLAFCPLGVSITFVHEFVCFGISATSSFSIVAVAEVVGALGAEEAWVHAGAVRVGSWAFLENSAVEEEVLWEVVEKASVVGRRVASAMIEKRAMMI